MSGHLFLTASGAALATTLSASFTTLSNTHWSLWCSNEYCGGRSERHKVRKQRCIHLGEHVVHHVARGAGGPQQHGLLGAVLEEHGEGLLADGAHNLQTTSTSCPVRTPPSKGRTGPALWRTAATLARSPVSRHLATPPGPRGEVAGEAVDDPDAGDRSGDGEAALR